MAPFNGWPDFPERMWPEFLEPASGIPNGDSPSLTRGPYSKDAAIHTERVLSYFKSSGLPQDQIAGTEINTWIKESGPTTRTSPEGTRTAEAVVTNRELIGFVTRVNRSIAGVPVEDSYAWAMFNADDEVAYEQVWWPELRNSLVGEIDEFRERLKDVEFKKRLDGEATGKLTIHHSTPTGRFWFAKVTYDVQAPSAPSVRHYDLTGRDVGVIAWE